MISPQNKIAWEDCAYEAWTLSYGSPAQAATDILANPTHKLRRVIKDLGEIKGLKILNPLGSNGRFGLAMAALGAEVTIVDISQSNKKYAEQLAQAAKVEMTYICKDYSSFSPLPEFDLVISELGIVHYFEDLNAYCRKSADALKPGGRFILNEFHPLMKKSISVNDGQGTITGDYFSSQIIEAETPYAVFTNQPNQQVPPCMIRRWTLGEIVTAIAHSGLRIMSLSEAPSAELGILPGMFTLVARLDEGSGGGHK